MNEIAKTEIDRFNELHDSITGNMRKTITEAIEAGEIITGIKKKIPHGTFTNWVNQNTRANIRTVQRYMNVYNRRDEIKSDTVSSLTEAYRLIEHKTKVDIAVEKAQQIIRDLDDGKYKDDLLKVLEDLDHIEAQLFGVPAIDMIELCLDYKMFWVKDPEEKIKILELLIEHSQKMGVEYGEIALRMMAKIGESK